MSSDNCSYDPVVLHIDCRASDAAMRWLSTQSQDKTAGGENQDCSSHEIFKPPSDVSILPLRCQRLFLIGVTNMFYLKNGLSLL